MKKNNKIHRTSCSPNYTTQLQTQTRVKHHNITWQQTKHELNKYSNTPIIKYILELTILKLWGYRHPKGSPKTNSITHKRSTSSSHAPSNTLLSLPSTPPPKRMPSQHNYLRKYILQINKTVREKLPELLRKWEKRSASDMEGTKLRYHGKQY